MYRQIKEFARIMTHEYSDHSDYTYEPYAEPTTLDRVADFVEEHRGKIAAVAGLGVVALLGAGLNGLNGGSNNPSRFEHSAENVTFTIKEGANVRVDPYVTGEPAARTLEQPLTLTTADGIYRHTEPDNGTWIGFKKDDAANLGNLNDNDNIVWTNISNLENSDR
jgi:hypothetical protein